MNQDMILGLARHILTTAGGVLVTKGLIDDGGMQLAVGAIITLAGVVWSLVSKKKPAA